jgi:hypothetical protein
MSRILSFTDRRVIATTRTPRARQIARLRADLAYLALYRPIAFQSIQALTARLASKSSGGRPLEKGGAR